MGSLSHPHVDMNEHTSLDVQFATSDVAGESPKGNHTSSLENAAESVLEAPEAYLIPDSNWGRFTREIERINKRAARLHAEPVSFAREYSHNLVKVVLRNGELSWLAEGSKIPWGAKVTGEVQQVWSVTVQGSTPKLNGWRLVAVLERVETNDGALNLLQTVPGESCPAEYRDRVGQCDHCGHPRQRKETFVVQHDDGSTKCVGRQCLGDFLGAFGNDPNRLATWCGYLASLNDTLGSLSDPFEGGGGGGRVRSWNLQGYLSAVHACIRVRGWSARWIKSHGEVEKNRNATADLAWLVAVPGALEDALRWVSRESDKKELRALVESCEPTPADEEAADTAIQWALDIESEDSYLLNLNTIARTGVATDKSLGYAASLINAWIKATTPQEPKQSRAKQHVGEIGKRAVFTVECVRVISSEGQWGTTGIHILRTPEGDTVVWYASGSTEWLGRGQSYQVKATPKKHDHYNGQPQTIVQRVAVVKEL